jgi:hypothetical protein
LLTARQKIGALQIVAGRRIEDADTPMAALGLSNEQFVDLADQLSRLAQGNRVVMPTPCDSDFLLVREFCDAVTFEPLSSPEVRGNSGAGVYPLAMTQPVQRTCGCSGCRNRSACLQTSG